MATKAVKLVAKYNALKMAALLLESQGKEFVSNIEDVCGEIPESLSNEIDKEIESLIKSLNNRADKAKDERDLPELALAVSRSLVGDIR